MLISLNVHFLLTRHIFKPKFFQIDVLSSMSMSGTCLTLAPPKSVTAKIGAELHTWEIPFVRRSVTKFGYPQLLHKLLVKR